MHISIRTHPPALVEPLCKDASPVGGACTLPAAHPGHLHVAHGADRSGYYIVAIWDGDRTTDEEA